MPQGNTVKKLTACRNTPDWSFTSALAATVLVFKLILQLPTKPNNFCHIVSVTPIPELFASLQLAIYNILQHKCAGKKSGDFFLPRKKTPSHQYDLKYKQIQKPYQKTPQNLKLRNIFGFLKMQKQKKL